MKIIAVIPAKNEEALLQFCIDSLKTWVDEVIIYDDHSTDRTKSIAEANGCIVITEDYHTKSGWPEYEIRERLLTEARRRGATHIVGIDTDEIFTPSFTSISRTRLAQMQPGDSLSLRWITLWKNISQERVDDIFNNVYKDFIFCDDGVSHHQYAFLGVGRIPRSAIGKKNTIEHDLGGVLHFQYVTWEKTQIKQAWYRCSELMKGERSARRINNMYASSLDGKHVVTSPIPKDWTIGVGDVSDVNAIGTWQYIQIIKWFDEHGVDFFEPLQIWHIPKLRKIFIESTDREPRPQTFPNWLVGLNNIKNKLKNAK